ncbi:MULTISPECIES: YidH family protein [unclassified Sphingosinithalassobacter]|uniref:YidH family protein n=1 Tax=unclassified Sphingosinithalassobacter TaxID=2676235 RepID=UPI0021CDEEB6|nr:DUF202 domain-containing protein [Sphingosinithalassobacter sp. CS137]
MSNSDGTNGKGEDRTDLADRRTDYAEDRTILANERTFAGWVRTGLAAVGIGVGFHALFGSIEPPWVPRAVASFFVAVGVIIVWSAQYRAWRVLKRLSAHRVEEIPRAYVWLIAVAVTLGGGVLVAGFWLMSDYSGI